MKVILNCLVIFGLAISGTFGDCEVGHYQAVQDDCTKFQLCEESGAYATLECPDGLHFNSELNVCDWAENVNCVPTEDEQTAQLKHFARVAAQSVGECEWGDYKADPENCNQFFQCEPSLNWSHHTCPAGLLFNSRLNVCDWPENVDCGSAGTQPTTPPTTTIVWTTANTTTSQPTTTSRPTEPTYPPTNGTEGTTIAPTTAPTTEWTTQSTETPETTGAPETTWTPPETTQEPNECGIVVDQSQIPPNAVGVCDPCEDPMFPTHLPDRYECTFFYKCAFGIPHRIECPPGQHWSIPLDRCEWPSVAQCNRPL